MREVLTDNSLFAIMFMQKTFTQIRTKCLRFFLKKCSLIVKNIHTKNQPP